MDSLELLPGIHLVIKLDAEISEQKQNDHKERPIRDSLLAGTGNPKSSAWVW